MNGKQLKAWALTIPDEARIEIKQYEWGELDHKKIRANWILYPATTLEDLCNLEDSCANG